MKRLLQVSFDTLLLSLMPILSWFMLSIIIDKNLINVFSLMYPIQFILTMLKSIFSVGANISKEKDKDKYAVGNGLLAAIIIGFLIYGLLLINIENYISFMKMDVNIYKDFAIYSVIYFYIQLVFNFIVEKLYYEEKNKLANKYSIIFNVLNFLLLILTYLITNSRLITIIVTLLVTFIYTLYLLLKERSKINFKFKILKWLKYDAVNFFHALCFFIIFLFGIRNAFSFGPQYSIAISFVSLITDTQWDVFTAINTLAKVDIAKGKFNYKESRNNAYKLLFILMVSIFIMFLIFHRTYNLNLLITFTFLSSEIYNFISYPVYSLKTTYLNLEYSYIKITGNKIFVNIARMFLSLINTPYCTSIGQFLSTTYQLFVINIMYKKHNK